MPASRTRILLLRLRNAKLFWKRFYQKWPDDSDRVALLCEKQRRTVLFFCECVEKNHRKTCTIALKQKIKIQNNIEIIIKTQYNTRRREKTHEKNVISSK